MTDDKFDLLIVSDFQGVLRNDSGLRNIELANTYQTAHHNFLVKTIMYTMSSKADFAEPILRKLFYNHFFQPAALDTRVVLRDGIYDIGNLTAPIDELCVYNPKGR